MKVHFQRDMERIEREILLLGSLVEQATNRAILALTSRRTDLARDVIEGDDEIDRREVELEDDCLKVLALHQPVASDLRYLISAIKVNTILERMGDLAVNIAERALKLNELAPLAVPAELQKMGADVSRMVKQCLDALVRHDTAMAREVCALDDNVDAANHAIFIELKTVMARDPGQIEQAMHLAVAARNLERIADHAENIAQDVVFTVEGQVIRHTSKD